MVRWDRAATGAATVAAVVMLAACGGGERKTESRGETQTAEVTATEATQETETETETTQETAEAADVETRGGEETAGTQMQEQEEGLDGGNFTDPRDNKTYRTVWIGRFRWMAENLNYQTDDIWMEENFNYEANHSRCYDDDPSNCEKYGRLYTWDVAMKACPAGWWLPSIQAWDGMAYAIGGWEIAETKLKSKTGWNDGGDGTDDYGFSALPGGIGYNGFDGAGSVGLWWSATEDVAYVDGTRDVLSQVMGNAVKVGVGRRRNKTEALSVRCVREDE